MKGSVQEVPSTSFLKMHFGTSCTEPFTTEVCNNKSQCPHAQQSQLKIRENAIKLVKILLLR